MSPIELIANPSAAVRLPVPIRTSRLLLRPFAAADAGSIAMLFADPETTQWMGGVKSEAESTASVLRMRDIFASRGWGTLAVVLADTLECIGYCGVRPLAHTQDVEIAFGLMKDRWGQGIATEAAVGCLDAVFATLPFGSIAATVYPNNERSIAVLKKLNMRQDATVFGQWPHSLALLFRVTREEWQRRG